MSSVRYDLTLDQGARFYLGLRFMTPSSSANPTLVPVDFTGYTAAAQVRDWYNNETILATFNVMFSGSNPVTGSSDAGGTLFLSLQGSQTSPLPGGLRAVWDLFVYPTGSIDDAERLTDGEVWIRSRVTR